MGDQHPKKEQEAPKWAPGAPPNDPERRKLQEEIQKKALEKFFDPALDDKFLDFLRSGQLDYFEDMAIRFGLARGLIVLHYPLSLENKLDRRDNHHKFMMMIGDIEKHIPPSTLFADFIADKPLKVDGKGIHWRIEIGSNHVPLLRRMLERHAPYLKRTVGEKEYNNLTVHEALALLTPVVYPAYSIWNMMEHDAINRRIHNIPFNPRHEAMIGAIDGEEPEVFFSTMMNGLRFTGTKKDDKRHLIRLQPLAKYTPFNVFCVHQGDKSIQDVLAMDHPAEDRPFVEALEKMYQRLSSGDFGIYLQLYGHEHVCDGVGNPPRTLNAWIADGLKNNMSTRNIIEFYVLLAQIVDQKTGKLPSLQDTDPVIALQIQLKLGELVSQNHTEVGNHFRSFLFGVKENTLSKKKTNLPADTQEIFKNCANLIHERENWKSLNAIEPPPWWAELMKKFLDTITPGPVLLTVGSSTLLILVMRYRARLAVLRTLNTLWSAWKADKLKRANNPGSRPDPSFTEKMDKTARKLGIRLSTLETMFDNDIFMQEHIERPLMTMKHNWAMESLGKLLSFPPDPNGAYKEVREATSFMNIHYGKIERFLSFTRQFEQFAPSHRYPTDVTMTDIVSAHERAQQVDKDGTITFERNGEWLTRRPMGRR